MAYLPVGILCDFKPTYVAQSQSLYSLCGQELQYHPSNRHRSLELAMFQGNQSFNPLSGRVHVSWGHGIKYVFLLPAVPARIFLAVAPAAMPLPHLDVDLQT